MIELNRAVAVSMAEGPEAALPLVDALSAGPALREYHLLPSVRGDLLARLGRREEAREEFLRAAELTGNARERQMLRGRAEGVGVEGARPGFFGEGLISAPDAPAASSVRRPPASGRP